MRAIGFTFFLFLVACGREAVVPDAPRARPAVATRRAPPQPRPAESSRPSRAERPPEREQLREPPPPALRDLPRDLPELIGSRPPAFCARLAAGPLSEPRRACGGSTLARLASALQLSAVERRDQALAQLEGCDELPKGWLRAVRADLARPCADGLVVPALRGLTTALDADLGETLLALALAARLARAVEKLPPYTGTGAADSLEQYWAKTLRPWKNRQLARLQTLSAADSLLEREGYGTAIAALARALATREIYSVARASPIATQLKKDYVLRTRYYGALDSELQDVRQRIPREDARVAGLLFEQGIHRAADADAWFGHQRADLVNLRIEPPPEVEPASDQERIVRSLPSPYVEALFGAAVLDDARLLRLMIEHGLTPRQRRTLAAGRLPPETNEILAHFQATLAIRTRRLGHFAEVVALLGPAEHRSSAAELLLATARSAQTGQRQLDPQTGEEQGWLFDVAALRTLAKANLPQRERAFALNNAAWLSLAANTPTSLNAASDLMSSAQALAPDDACLRPFYSGWLDPNRRRPPCTLPLLP